MTQHSPLIRKLLPLFLIFVLLTTSAAAPLGARQAGPAQSVIVQALSAHQAGLLVAKWGGTVTSELDIIQGVGATLPQSSLAALRAEPGIVRVTDNAATMLTSHTFDRAAKNIPETDYPDVTGADLAWKKGALGKNISVAIVDTGIALHPSLMVDEKGKKRMPVIGWKDFIDGRRLPVDPNGHGTHIAGIIANAAKGTDGEYNGMAPGVNLVGIRVLDETGSGTYETVIQGIQWAVKYRNRLNIKVLNLSLYSLVQSPYWADPLNQAVMRAWAEGITVVVAAGNSGPNGMTIAVPGNTPYAITVGAFTDNYTPTDWNDDYLAPFSSAGPTLDGFVKPDLLAPGAHITSTMLPGSYIAEHHEASWVDGLYFSMAGTSQASAVVSGAVAQMLAQQKRSLSPDEVKYRLMVTALPWINLEESDVLYSVWQQGAGRLNAYDAIIAKDIEGAANEGLDIQADLDGTQHFEGFSYYDEATGTFLLHGYEAVPGGYGSWSGGYGSWSGKYGSWSGKYGSWSGGYGSWSGKYGSWSGGYGSWSGKYGSWSGGYGSWSGGYGSWSGKYGSWSGGFGVWAGQLSDPTFVENFLNGVSPDVSASTASIEWITE